MYGSGKTLPRPRLCPDGVYNVSMNSHFTLTIKSQYFVYFAFVDLHSIMKWYIIILDLIFFSNSSNIYRLWFQFVGLEILKQEINHIIF